MQFMPLDIPTAVLSGDNDPEFKELNEAVRLELERAVSEEGLDLSKPFSITLLEGKAQVTNVDASALEGSLGSVREINAIISNGALPDGYTSGESQADDPLWASHLSGNWGF